MIYHTFYFYLFFISGPRCIADYFETYLGALGHEGSFYRKPLSSLGMTKLRYGEQPVGVNKLKHFMKTICDKAGLKGNYSKHSGKRSCATSLYQAGIDEQEIMSRTGHRSKIQSSVVWSSQENFCSSQPTISKTRKIRKKKLCPMRMSKLVYVKLKRQIHANLKRHWVILQINWVPLQMASSSQTVHFSFRLFETTINKTSDILQCHKIRSFTSWRICPGLLRNVIFKISR